MIEKSEIEAKAKEFEIPPTSVEKDYVFGWFLYGLFSASALRHSIFLKGGNALRKGYFENTRYSSDLDFGIPNDIDQNFLLEDINGICDFIESKAGVNFLKSDNKVEEKFALGEEPLPNLKVYELKIYFKDFHAKKDHLKLKISMDITRFDRVLLPLQTVKLIHPYSDHEEVSCDIRCMKLEEIIATKLKCLLQRQHAPDLFDYVYSIKLLGGELNREEVVNTFIKKTIFSKNPHLVKDILQKTPFDYFKSVWQKTVVCAKTFLFQAEDAIALFLSDLEELFSIYPERYSHQLVFFGSDLRMPILEAGRRQLLLKIRYKHSERLVEPYALKYLQRKDGQEREYLYVYNLEGGENPPGQRSLVADNFQSIEVTDQKFEPRFPIELSKAGELPENRFLFDPNRPIKAPRRGIFRSSKSYAPKYIYQCTACGKKFSKLKRNSELGEHKNKNGYRCGSSRGIYIETKYP